MYSWSHKKFQMYFSARTKFQLYFSTYVKFQPGWGSIDCVLRLARKVPDVFVWSRKVPDVAEPAE